jgi:hypothetical protein
MQDNASAITAYSPTQTSLIKVNAICLVRAWEEAISSVAEASHCQYTPGMACPPEDITISDEPAFTRDWLTAGEPTSTSVLEGVHQKCVDRI